tara:strand:+ start:30379 stop:30951 length:573 start_codon:yes stop_codon:yes gene_type:complete
MATTKTAKTAQKPKAKPNTRAKRNPKATTRVTKNTKAANTKMANRLKNSADEAGDQFEDMAQNMEQRAEKSARGVVNMTKSAIEFQRQNVEALIESGKLTAEGVLRLSRTNMKYTRENLVAASRALQGMASRGTPKQLAARQVDYVLGGVNRVIDQVATNVEIAIEITGTVYQPIGTRLNDIRSEAAEAA